MYPGQYAITTPDKPAAILAESGTARSYAELNEQSNRLAQFWWQQGLRLGDHVAIFIENRLEYFDAMWAALRSGLHLTPVNRYLTTSEAAYIVNDCGARSVISSAYLEAAHGLPDHAPQCETWLMAGGNAPGWQSYEDAVASSAAAPLVAEPRGSFMFYSSGTTGHPKGIKQTLAGDSIADEDPLMVSFQPAFGYNHESVYLSPGPLYHAAPSVWCQWIQSYGGTTVVMERFDAADALRFIEQYKVTDSQWVPTMFTRMLKLPEAERQRHDLSTHRCVVHAAAPCPVEIKRQMIDWWGPILLEYYAGSEGNGMCFIDSENWLANPGSVGRAIWGTIHICDSDGSELPSGEIGIIYFAQDTQPFSYHNDADKTRQAQHPHNPTWTTLGDLGYVNEEGFLFLTDRKDFTIISGGVNIYPREIEDVLVLHPTVLDAAVFGIPDDEMGEKVKAVVELVQEVEESSELAEELVGYVREHLAHYKAPKSIDFTTKLPRLPTGKLYKRFLRDAYWTKTKAD